MANLGGSAGGSIPLSACHGLDTQMTKFPCKKFHVHGKVNKMSSRFKRCNSIIDPPPGKYRKPPMALSPWDISDPENNGHNNNKSKKNTILHIYLFTITKCTKSQLIKGRGVNAGKRNHKEYIFYIKYTRLVR